MAKMKEIYMELQEMYGMDLEDAPENFSMDEYLKEVADAL